MRFPPPLTPNGPDILYPPEDAVDSLAEGLGRNPNYVLFSQGEMNALVEEASRADCPVAAHCQSNEAIQMAAKAGVTSIEHGQSANEETLRIVKEHGCIFVPTLAVMEVFVKEDKMAEVLEVTKTASDLGVQLACGGDTGAFAHGDNVRELELMLKAGVPLEEVLYAATVGGWKACGSMRCGRKFGWWGDGCAADIIALKADPREDSTALRQVDFVMKDAKIYKRDGQSVGM